MQTPSDCYLSFLEAIAEASELAKEDVSLVTMLHRVCSSQGLTGGFLGELSKYSDGISVLSCDWFPWKSSA